jgi:hypothetical protein
MAEGGEGGGKAGDLYLGVVDLFAVILPGALFCGLAWKVLDHKEKGWELLEGVSGPEFVPKWLVFLIVAYIAGHFLFALGAWIMDPLYDRYYKYKFEKAKRLASIRRRADRLMWQVVGDPFYSEGDNRLTWAESLLRMSAASAKAELDRLEADSKFFRSLAVVSILTVAILFSPLTGWVDLRLWVEAVAIAITFLVIVNLASKALTNQAGVRERVSVRLMGGTYFPNRKVTLKAILNRLIGKEGRQAKYENMPSRFTWPDEEWATQEVAVTQTDAERIRALVYLLPVAWAVLVGWLAAIAERNGHDQAWLAALACYLLTLASGHRFMEIRAKRLVEAYYFVIALNKSSAFNPAPAEKKP